MELLNSIHLTDIQICFDAKKPCLTDLSVFKNTKLPKKPCEWRTGFLNEGKQILFDNMYFKRVPFTLP